MNFWKWSGESWYPGALPSLLENFRSAVSPDPTDYPWVSEDGIGQITVPMDKGNAGSGEEKDSKCRQDPSGRPARVVKRWGGCVGGISIIRFAVTSNGNLFPILRKTIWQTKSTMNHNSRAKESISRGKKAESPNTLYHALALRHVRINKLF